MEREKQMIEFIKDIIEAFMKPLKDENVRDFILKINEKIETIEYKIEKDGYCFYFNRLIKLKFLICQITKLSMKNAKMRNSKNGFKWAFFDKMSIL